MASTDRCLDAAVRIGDLLVREAFHCDDLCSWMGATLDEPIGGHPTSVHVALGPDLYSGTSGVAMFLAELYAACRQRCFRDVAVSAARHAAAGLGRQPSEAIGLYDGLVGIAISLWRIAEVLGEPGLARGVLDRLASLEVPGPDARENDVIGGTAGAALGLVTLAVATGRSDLLASAQRFGDALLESAERCRSTMSWRYPRRSRAKNLTGYSHGAAGCATALLELYAIDGNVVWRDAALAAFAYEATLYNPDVGNWPDLRDIARSTKISRETMLCETLWCHGAPGIALARVRAVEILGDGPWGDEARIALMTTERAVAKALDSGGASYCLCHGIAGNAEVLLRGRSVFADGERTALRAALWGVDRFGHDPTSWPCGVLEGRTPALLTGLAGIGRFLLRVADPSLPSVLSISPATWAKRTKKKVAR